VTDNHQFLPGAGCALQYNSGQALDNASRAISIGEDAGKEHLVAACAQPIREWVKGSVACQKPGNQQDRSAFGCTSADPPGPRMPCKFCKFSNCAKLLQQVDEGEVACLKLAHP